MAKKTISFKTKGMNRDLSVSAFNPEFSFENRNLRLSTNEGNTMMSWVNEKGTLLLKTYETGSSAESNIIGTPIGTAILNHYLVVFTTNSGESTTPDRIYKLKYKDTDKTSLEYTLLYKGNLGFSTDYPIDTLVSYEAESIQKVYWVDGKNQTRMINIAHKEGTKEGYTDGNGGYNPFDFAPELELNDSVVVKKLLGANGSFAPGVIQYAFTYYNKNGQESAVFNVTPLYYISYKDRGASPEDKVENAFRITVNNIDQHFEYLRIYSIQRTSLNATPIVKRLQDIKINSISATYTDTGYSGNTVDPTELLYKGSEVFSAKTIEQKDATLFLGNLKMSRPNIKNYENGVRSNFSVNEDSYRDIYPTVVSYYPYNYSNQLTTFSSSAKNESVPCGYFKSGDKYRLGIQFQYKNGKWSEPVILAVPKEATTGNKSGTYSTSMRPDISGSYIRVPRFAATINGTMVSNLVNGGYKRARSVVVFPSIQDRVTLCQGVACPTLKTNNTDNNISAQSSWFFRTPQDGSSSLVSSGAVAPLGSGTIPYASRNTVSSPYNPNGTTNIKSVEVQGSFDSANMFQINWSTWTFHSPDVEFDDWAAVSDFNDVKLYQVGQANISRTLSDIDIQTESPTASNGGGGFVHKSFTRNGMFGIVSGLFYDDYVLDDNNDNKIQKYSKEKCSAKWMVYLWNKGGSLNNDINRSTDLGTASAILKKKIVSNLRYADKVDFSSDISISSYYQPQLFSSDEPTILKLGNSEVYMGNIDTLLMPDNTDGMYFALQSDTDNALLTENSEPSFTKDVLWKTFSKSDDESDGQGIWHFKNSDKTWNRVNGDIGNKYADLVIKKDSVRMKYKSTAHLVCNGGSLLNNTTNGYVPVVEMRRNVDDTTIFGGYSDDALMENTWVPCGKPVKMTAGSPVTVYYEYGDTYYQRWDCLKTYPFTTEDVNQVVEIGSFMLETRINIDGRYDRNRGQISNLNMSPRNFNLLNPIYSQVDNFFSYKILDESNYENTEFPNQITWSLTKENGADVDAWTHITLANILELDGDKGELNKLTRFSDQLLAFQDTGISQIQYNENVQINSTDGVPIEIANSGKVQGKRYLSDTIGCSNKWAMATTPSGIYFMDNADRSIYLFNGQLQNLSINEGLNSWCKQNIKSVEDSKDTEWTPTGFNNFVAYYDKLNQDILFINDDIALAFSERFSTFTSFYDYGDTPFYDNLDNTGIWLKDGKFYRHNAGEYSNFFGTVKPYWMTLIGNPEPQISKVFTNLELRANVDGDGSYDETTGKIVPSLPFDYLETWDEYQHGYTSLANLKGNALMQHHESDEASLKRKFRIWRCDIPRDNALLDKDRKDDVVYNYSKDADLNISRFKARPLDRMRNPWLYLKLEKNVPEDATSLPKTEVHDIMMTYFS